MSTDRSLTTPCIASQPSPEARAFYADIRQRIITIGDTKPTKSFVAILVDMDDNLRYEHWAEYWYLRSILVDITYFYYRSTSGVRWYPPRPVTFQADSDSPYLQHRYAMLHYATMYQLARRSSAQLSDRYRHYFAECAYAQADRVVATLPRKDRQPDPVSVENRVELPEAILDLSAELIASCTQPVRERPTASVRRFLRPMQRAKSP